MDILPLKTLTDEDLADFGDSLIKLAKLYHNELPVADNLVITSLIDIPKKIPANLATKLKFCPVILYKNEFFNDKNKLWQSICSEWDKQRLWQETQGFSIKLLPQVIFLFNKSYPLAMSYYNPDLAEITIQCDQHLDPKILQEIDKLVINANKKLFIPQVYTMIIKENLPRIVKISPFTQIIHTKPQSNVMIHKTSVSKIPSILKIYLNSKSGFSKEGLDGAVLEAEQFTNFDEIVLTLEKASKILPRVLLRVIEPIKPDYLKAYHFCYDKKNLTNLKVIFPPSVTLSETAHNWLQFNNPENIINLEKYLTEKVEGVVINLDLLHKFLGAKEYDIQTLLKFLDAPWKVLKKHKIPILVEGKAFLNADVLDFILENGVTGVILQTIQEVESMPEYIDWTLRRKLAKKLL